MTNRKNRNHGFTLIELMVTAIIVVIAIIGISGVIAGSHRDYSEMFKRVHGDIANDAYTARLRFDKVCRKAKAGSAVIDSSVPSLQVLYYSSPNVNGSALLELSPPDSFAKFYKSGSNLLLETGLIGTTDDTPEVVARNVTELEFSYSNPEDSKSVQMVMTLDKDASNANDYSITITCGSIMHN
jgi:hypothetical protein